MTRTLLRSAAFLTRVQGRSAWSPRFRNVTEPWGRYERIVDRGVVAAVGHTEATYEQTRVAIAAGATVGTHLFNAMRPINTREPGPVVALVEDARVTVELITDGVHVHPALYRHVCRTARDPTGCRSSPTRWQRPG